MFSQCEEAFYHQLAEFFKPLRVCAAHYINILLSELECDRFEIHVARRVGKHKTEVYMHHMTLAVQEDVSIMSVFDLQNVA